MTQTRRSHDKRQQGAHAAPHTADGDDVLGWLLKSVVAALLVARLLVPTESAADGDTLWLVQLWLGAAAVWVWYSFREGWRRPRVDWFDLFLWLVIAGHAASTVWVFVDGGHKRAALNMLWEWIGLGVAFFLTRQVVRTSIDGRRLALAMVATTTGLAGLGLWQHYVLYPTETRKYEQIRAELDELEKATSPATFDEATARQARINDIRRQLTEQGTPLEGPDRVLWEARLRASSEPFGLFALANSFAGLLLVWLIVAAGILTVTVSNRGNEATARGRQILLRLVPPGVVGLLLFCLILTKSRTAFLGLAVGVTAWALLAGRSRKAGFGRTGRITLIVGVVAVLAGFATAGLSGGFDWKVISESSKSLRYRVEYWAGSLQALRERPLFGSGPGNFRQHYLKHKLAESSEEIADPHNFILDVWASGGTVALCGLAGMLVTGFGVLRRRKRDGQTAEAIDLRHQADSEQRLHRSAFRDPLLVGGAGGFALVWGMDTWIGEIGPEVYQFVALPLLLLTYLVLVWCLDQCLAAREIPVACFAAAGVGLLIHLLGAGGIEMPAIAQILLILPVLASTDRPGTVQAPSQSRPVFALILGVACVAAFFACLRSATQPVLERKSLLSRSDFRSLDHAETVYHKAMVSDPLSPEPLERLADVEFSRWYNSNGADPSRLSKAVEIQQIAIGLNPHSASGYQKLGRWHQLKYSRTHDVQDAQKAAEFFTQAMSRYPTSAPLVAELAEAHNSAGNKAEARRTAEMALQLDELNHKKGHRDKFLPRETLEKLSKITH